MRRVGIVTSPCRPDPCTARTSIAPYSASGQLAAISTARCLGLAVDRQIAGKVFLASANGPSVTASAPPRTPHGLGGRRIGKGFAAEQLAAFR